MNRYEARRENIFDEYHLGFWVKNKVNLITLQFKAQFTGIQNLLKFDIGDI